MAHRAKKALTLTSSSMVLGVMAMLVGLSTPVQAKPSEHPFEIAPGSFQITPFTTREVEREIEVAGKKERVAVSEETPWYEAGAHADWLIYFDFAHTASGSTYNDARAVTLNFPAGFNASNTAVPTCTFAQLIGGSETLPACPVASQVGQISFEIANPDKEGDPPAHFTAPLFNMEVTSSGVAAELGYKTVLYTETMHVGVRPSDDGLTGIATDIPRLEPHKISVVLWALPAAHVHDEQRGQTCGEDFENPPICSHPASGGPEEANIPVRPFLSNPTSCPKEPFTATLEAYSWEAPLAPPAVASAGIGPFSECERVPFEPEIEARPTTTSAESPSGLNVSIVVRQAWDNPYTISTSNLKDAKVTLPEGMTINPSAGSGLGACTPHQYEEETFESVSGEGCPPESKIGSIEIETPLLAEKIQGAIYVAEPYNNVPAFGDELHPNGSLLAIYVVAKDPQRGILIKVAGKIEPDPVTGRLVTTFLNNPQQPFSKFTLKFRPGATAPLVSPPACGSYTLQAALTPWSAPEEPRLISSSPFAISKGVREGPCPSSGVPPFNPQLIAGTQNNAGGSYSPFYLRILREDGEQEITRFAMGLPPGLTGNLTGIPFCSDNTIEIARGSSGREEFNKPSCPAASEVGHTIVSAGVGTVLAQTPGKVYLAGPYHGAALSLVSVTSATVGPFDLGTVVIRFALRINPLTAQVEVDASGSDPIPHIIHGIVVHVRDIRVYMDRTHFIINPTNCQRTAINAMITGAGANYANPADQVSVTVRNPFEAADCASLAFKPTLKAYTSSKTSRKRGANLRVKLTYPDAPEGTQANIRSVKVTLPKQLASRLETLQKACRDTVFDSNPAACPAASLVGTAEAITPVVPVPLEGPAYFVSHGSERFPELIVVLQGYGLRIDLHGETFIDKKTGITSSTFRAVPDQPVKSFELSLPQGVYSALASNGDLCSVPHKIVVRKKVVVRLRGRRKTVLRKVRKTAFGVLAMPTAFTAQNGLVIHRTTSIRVTGCAKHPGARGGKKHRSRRRRRNR